MLVDIIKTKIEEGQDSAVFVGQTETGTLMIGRSPGEGKDNESVENVILSDIKVDDTVIVFNIFAFLKTSPVVEILEQSDDEVVIRTTTSTYRLLLIEEDKEEE